MKMLKKSVLLAVSCLVMVVFAAGALCAPDLPDNKKTTLGLYADAQKAYAMWKSDPASVVIIDCRTPEEYVFVGHPAMAYNIPSKLMTHEFDPQKKSYKMIANPHFVEQVKKHFSQNQTLMILCRSGSRSAKSVNLLAQAGYTNVYTIVDGFEGDKVKDDNNYFKGQRMVNGWKNSGNPWTYANDQALVYLPTK
jgi:rhodanese-related sulfurtransferase